MRRNEKCKSNLFLRWVWSTGCYSAQAKACTPNLGLAFSWRPSRLGGRRMVSHSPPRRQERQESRQAELFPGENFQLSSTESDAPGFCNHVRSAVVARLRGRRRDTTGLAAYL